MERRLKMMIAGSVAVWVPVATAAQAPSAVIDPGKAYRIKAEATSDSTARSSPD